jgi:hypothetical protein
MKDRCKKWNYKSWTLQDKCMEYYVTHQLFLSNVMAVYIFASSYLQPLSPFASNSNTNYGHHNRIQHSTTHPLNRRSQQQLEYWIKFVSSIFPQNTNIPSMVAITYLDHMSPQHQRTLNQTRFESDHHWHQVCNNGFNDQLLTLSTPHFIHH